MNSIAKILCLGSLESDDDKRNNALTIVSQMLLDSSPKRKRRCLEPKSPKKENVLVPESIDINSENSIKKDEVAFGGMIPDTLIHSPLKSITNISSEKFPVKDNNTNCQTSNTGLSASVNLPIVSSREKLKKKKNLSADCIHSQDDNDVIELSPANKKKTLSFNIGLEKVGLNKNRIYDEVRNDTTLDATLLEYVKDTRTELDKIWFDGESSNKTAFQLKNSCVQDSKGRLSTVNSIIEETPSREETKKEAGKKRADFWLLKDKRELCGNSRGLDGKKMRQTKLELGIKQKSVDISKLAGFNGGILQQQIPEKDDDIIPASPGIELREPLMSNSDINDLESRGFQPLACSTQRSVDNIISYRKPCSSKSSDYVFKRDAIKKQSERAKLPGWDCDQCRKYYGAMSLSPSKVKERMNACSRHRDKFKPKLNETPPGFWNPLFPDTEEIKEKGMCVSIYCPAKDS